ncbi:MAG: glycosyl transferase family 1, partial [Lachnospiraceae bacterium]|nr:glycosyl transferase family 1 [Lachnospiraceae bacterium]
MKILSVTAQKPNSTGSGVYLTELVKAWDNMGISQAVIGGISKDEKDDFKNGIIAGVKFYPVLHETKSLNFPVCGMSDSMPYKATKY